MIAGPQLAWSRKPFVTTELQWRCPTKTPVVRWQEFAFNLPEFMRSDSNRQHQIGSQPSESALDQIFHSQVPACAARHFFRILRQNVDFDIHQIARAQRMQVGGLIGMRDYGDFYSIAVDPGHGEADAFDGN